MAEGETFKASVILRGNGGTAVVFDFGYVDLTSGSGHVDTGTAAGDFQTLVQDTMADCLPDQVSFVKYRFACVGGTHIGEIGYVTVDPPVAGNITGGTVLPFEVCISLRRATGYSSRRDRGRIFFGPVSDTFHQESNPDYVTFTSDLDLVRDLLKTNLVTQTRTLRPVILAADGTYSGRTVSKVEVAGVFTHRKSRRFRQLV